jgi:hypothetical protein
LTPSYLEQDQAENLQQLIVQQEQMGNHYRSQFNILYDPNNEPHSGLRPSLINLDKSYQIISELKKQKKNNRIILSGEETNPQTSLMNLSVQPNQQNMNMNMNGE